MADNRILAFQPARLPDERTLQGRFVRLEKFNLAEHSDGLFTALQGPDSDPKLFDYLPWGPFPNQTDFTAWITTYTAKADPWVYVVIDQTTGIINGNLSLMSIVPAHGTTEIGGVAFGAGMQRTPKSTEAVFLLMKEAFALGNRRLEWKCNNANARSRRAAERFGFTFEAVFRQHMVLKGRNRDTAWYSIIDTEWPALQAAFEAWLSEENFDKHGQQIKALEAFRQRRVSKAEDELCNEQSKVLTMENSPGIDFKPAKLPHNEVLEGRFIRLEKLDPERHAAGLFTALHGSDSDATLWTYLPWGPFSDQTEFTAWGMAYNSLPDRYVYCIIDRATGIIDGTICLMNFIPAHGRIEIGGIIFGAGMQRTPKGTEAIYLLMREAFALGNRRLEWKCNNENGRSKRAAERCGFKFEAFLRQHQVVKGRNRDTAWFSVIDSAWPALQTSFEGWLSQDNFDKNGQQIKALEAFQRACELDKGQ